MKCATGSDARRTPKDAWREAASNYKPRPGAAEYLTFLSANGYPLAPIEQVLTGERTADAVYEELAHQARCQSDPSGHNGPADPDPAFAVTKL